MPLRFRAQITRLELLATMAAAKAAVADLRERLSELDAGLQRLPSDAPHHDDRAARLAELRVTLASDVSNLRAAVAEVVATLAAMECS